MQQLECETNSITCMSCLYVHVYGNKVIYLSIYSKWYNFYHHVMNIVRIKCSMCEEFRGGSCLGPGL